MELQPSCTLIITDGTLTATANQVYHRYPVNDAPIAVTDNYTTAEANSVQLLPLTAIATQTESTPTIQSIKEQY
jgi:hypothetical protein